MLEYLVFQECHQNNLYSNSFSNIDMVMLDIISKSDNVCSLQIDLERIYNNDIKLLTENFNIAFSEIFYKLSLINKTSAIPKHIIKDLNDKINQIFKMVSKEQLDNIHLLALNIIISNSFSQSDEIIITVLDNISNLHSDLYNELIFTKFSAGIILPIQALLYVKEEIDKELQGINQKINFEVFDSFDELKFFIEGHKNFDEFTTSIIVRHPESSHTTQVFLKKYKSNYNILISDSLGHFLDLNNNTSKFSISLIRLFSEILQESQMNLYVVKHQRQRDHANCLIFSLLDVQEIYKLNDVFEFLNDKSTIEIDFINIGTEENPRFTCVKWITTLPFQFKKGEQSIRKIYEDFSNSICISEVDQFVQTYKWCVLYPESEDYRVNREQKCYIIKNRNYLIKLIVEKSLGKLN